MHRQVLPRLLLVVVLAFAASCAGARAQGFSSPYTESGPTKSVGAAEQKAPPAPATATQGGAASAGPASFAATSENVYRIGSFDVLDISVFQVPELTKSVQVADSGTINLPLVGEVRVAGRTAQEVERDLTAKLGADYLQNPQVTVFVKEYNSQNVTVSGAVKKPGVYPIRGKTTLVQMVALAGDFDEGSDSTVLILREQGGKRMAGKFDVSAIRNGQAQDPALQGGDQIVAGTSAIKKGFNTILRSLPLVGTFALL